MEVMASVQDITAIGVTPIPNLVPWWSVYCVAHIFIGSFVLLNLIVGVVINNYNKIYKLLRNLIIHSAATIEEIQMEVYVQNSDAFVTLIANCLKYIRVNAQSQKLVPYDLIGLINDLISKIAKKSK